MAKVLIIGSGARESALGQAFLASPQVTAVYVAPGNAGMPLLGLTPVAITEEQTAALVAFAADVDLTFVGPEQPLAAGLVDAFQAAGRPVFGPTQKVAQLESSKQFAKAFMAAHHLPTAAVKVAHSQREAIAAAAMMSLPLVIKVDGLAAGKGVTIATNPETVQATLAALYAADAQAPVLLEEYLSGQEASVLAMFNGTKRVLFPLAQDHKRRFAGDTGPNTGGMGAISPAPQFSTAQQAQAAALVDQTLAGMVADGLTSTGVLYVGLMFTSHGPKILEYNLRFGDPETQVLLPQVTNDFYQLTLDLLAGQAPALTLNGQTYCGVVAVNPAYPQSGPALPLVRPTADQCGYWIPAGVAKQGDTLVSHGGRIFTVIGSGADLAAAQREAYARMAPLQGPLAVRDDIGAKGL